jgi:alkylhydroperoxidase family enzyme
MTWITTISEHQATGELAETYAIARARSGTVSNIAEAASINPRVMRALSDLHHALRGAHCALGARRQEMIAVLTSALHRCAY